MKRTLVALALCSVSGLALADAPFCLVNNYGNANCYYFTLDSCLQAAKSMGGACAANPQRLPEQTRRNGRSVDLSRIGLDGIDQANRSREHEAQMRLLEAQADAARAQAEAVRVQAEATRAPTQKPTPPKTETSAAPRLVVYMCSRPGEASVFTKVPEVGCIVSAVEW